MTPEQVFEVLADAAAWPRWATVITGVTWTSPEPHGVGTTRLTGPARLFAPFSAPLMNLAFRRFLSHLRRYTDQRFGVVH